MNADDRTPRGRGSRGRAHDRRTAHSEAGEPPQAGSGDRADQDAETGPSQKTDQETVADQEQRARETVYRLLAARARSRSELMQALTRKGIDEEVATRTLDKFDEAGLVDDAGFAESWVRQRHEQQGLGRRALGSELRRKGVDEEAVADALAHVDDEAEFTRARELVRRKLRTTTVTDPTTRTRRLVSMLARKGYSEGMAFRAVREELESSEMDEPDQDTP